MVEVSRGFSNCPEQTSLKSPGRYIDSELKEKNIAHARNLLDRAVTILPRVDQLWFKYVAVEGTLVTF